MTIRDIIERVKARRTSPLPESLLIAALSELDMRIEQDCGLAFVEIGRKHPQVVSVALRLKPFVLQVVL